MRVIIASDAAQVAQLSADLVVEQLQSKPASVFGLATGSTPVALYAQLVARYQAGDISFAQASSFNLDEYVGLPAHHPQSYRYFMQQHLFDQIDIDVTRTQVPCGLANPQQECLRYEQAIEKAGGVDLQILGLGINGHIGFNEPSSSLSSKTRVKTLTQGTMAANARFFAAHEKQPELALTMGIGTIMQARKVLLLATGTDKAKAVKATVEGAVSAHNPASILQFHEFATLVLDQQSAALLEHGDYYQWVEQVRRRVGLSVVPDIVAGQSAQLQSARGLS